MKPQENKLDEVEEATQASHAKDTRQLAQSLTLAVAQIDMSLEEAGNSVELLVESITSMAGHLRQMQVSLEHVDSSASVQAECTLAGEQVQQAIVAFQFYDRMSQRFSHIKENLAEILTVMSAPECEHSALWCNLQKRMRTV